MPKSPAIPNLKVEVKPDIHNDVKTEAAQKAKPSVGDIKPVSSPAVKAEISLYDIPLAPSAPPAVPANTAPSPPEVYDLTGSDDDAMVIDIDDSGNSASGHRSEFHDEDADTVYHSGGDSDSDSDSEVSSLDDSDREISSAGVQPARKRRRLSPNVSHMRGIINQDDHAEDGTRRDFYKAIYDHIDISDKIEIQTERLMDCKDPAGRKRRGERLQRLELQRRASRKAIERVLGDEDRLNEAELDQAMALAAPGGAPETHPEYRQRRAHERRQQVDRRIAAVRDATERARRKDAYSKCAKQAAKEGTKRMKLGVRKARLEKRAMNAQKQKDEAEARRAALEEAAAALQEERDRRRGRGRRSQPAADINDNNVPSDAESVMEIASA
ncbi:hypothetical protein PG991_013447 [Apiospora marii]|uniref:Ribosomal RNA-processing protein 14/surfeit locus protein 6 C-terminal domain-containing protein n=1 Tax=Apiospora marii TaxID=335849 RepID=A0ABR1R604_9PEZI